jgi:KUP system potassium uptake protein
MNEVASDTAAQSDRATPVPGHEAPTGFWALTLGSVGVVYGDIGTSPLYAFREAAWRRANRVRSRARSCSACCP